MTRPIWKRWLFPGTSAWLLLSLVVVALDQLSKAWIVTRLELYERIVADPYLDITRLHNTGAAFSFLDGAGGWQRWLFVVLGIGVSVAIVVWLRRLPTRGHHLLSAGLAFIVGGALGNVMDRLVHGYVIDFIYAHYRGWYFPAFNLADSAITVGAGLLIIDTLWGGSRNHPRKLEDEGS